MGGTAHAGTPTSPPADDQATYSIVEAISDAAARISAAGVIVQANTALGRLAGRSPAELAETPLSDLVCEADRDAVGRLVAATADGVSRGEATLTAIGQPPLPVGLTVSAVPWADSERLVVVTDLTAEPSAQDKNSAIRAYSRSLLDAAVHPVATIDPRGLIADVSTAAERSMGLSRADVVGTELAAYFADAGRARDAFARTFDEDLVRNVALDLRHADGHLTPVLLTASVFRGQAGEVLGAFCALRDVTLVRESAAVVRGSEERLRVIFENAPIGIDELTPGGKIVRVNQHFCDIVGRRAEELADRQIDDIIHPDDRAADRASTDRLVAGQMPSYTAEKRFVGKDGADIWAEVSRTLVTDDHGDPMLIVGAVRDISAQRQAEAQVRALNADLEMRVEGRTAELERVNKNLEAFTYSVSHDLRAPLRAMSGFSEALLEDYRDSLDETALGYAERIQAAAERMAHLIDDLLALSRVSRADISHSRIDLSAEAATIADDLRRREPERRARFELQPGVEVSADRPLIRAVMQNLMENAWKFASKRTETEIEFGTAIAEAGLVCCFLRDNGAGFDEAYASKLFQPFQRLHSEAEYPGTGIGLASVQRIIERHGGRVWAEGVVDLGATFYFTLPAVAPPIG
ncbi:MAG TPA: PAS domain S-box protein [Streptosporangiaceae bacterium]|nr:PAS domain S-box protein [Streptosporangiaceae bacterium]